MIDNIDVKEEYVVKAFSCIDKINLRLRQINAKLSRLYTKKSELEEELALLKKDYKELLLLNIGKGKYYHIEQELFGLTQRLKSLEEAIYDSYSRELDTKKQKEYDLLKRPLEEDIEQAALEVDKLHNHKNNVNEQIETKKHELALVKGEIKTYEKESTSLQNDKDKISYSIKVVSDSMETNKPIKKRHISLIKKYTNEINK